MSVPLNGQSQKQFSEIFEIDKLLAEKEAAIRAATCIKNNNDFLPLRSLDTLSIGILSFGKDTVFSEIANNYLPCYESRLSLNATKADITSALARLAEANLLIVHLTANGNTRNNFGLSPDILKTLPLVLKQQKSVLVLNSAKGLLNILPLQYPAAILYSPLVSTVSQSVLAQAMFGAQTISGTPPPANNTVFSNGYAVKSINRLAYGQAEEQGMDGRFLQKEIADICHQGIDAGAFPGCQVLVARNGMVVFHQAYGYHTYQNSRKVQLNDIYDYASLTKITAALPALIRLHGEGRLDIENGTWGQYVALLKGSNKAEIGLKDVLSHQAGLQPYIPYWKQTLRKNGSFKWFTVKAKQNNRFPLPLDDKLYVHRKFPQKIAKTIIDSPLEPAGNYKYSGLFFYLAPQMLEKMVEKDFEAYLKETFYQPLGATSITFNPLRYYPKDRIVPTEIDDFFRKKLVHGYVHDEGAAMMGGVSSNAGLFSTANDLAKLAQLYLNNGSYGGESYFPEESLALFTRRHFAATGNRRALGFDKPRLKNKANDAVSELASEESYGHSGYTGTFLWIDPKESLVYIFFSNRVHPSRDRGKIYELNIRPRIHHALYESIRAFSQKE